MLLARSSEVRFLNRRDIIKSVVLILLPINTWLLVLYYVHEQQASLLRPSLARHRNSVTVRVDYFRKKLGLQEGQRLVYPFPVHLTLMGHAPPVGQGKPVLFLNIDWLAFPEVWGPIVREILPAYPDLHIVLLHSMPIDLNASSRSLHFNVFQQQWEYAQRQRAKLWENLHHPRLSILPGRWIKTALGGNLGILLFLCDGQGMVRVIEVYPQLKFSPEWNEEVRDWRTKLRQAVKRALERFFGKAIKEK